MESNKFAEEQNFLKAKQKVKEIKAFYVHALVFILCMPIIIITNFMFVPGFHFFWLALMGWGIGIAIHGFVVFGRNLFFNKDWEERKIKEFMDKENNYKF
jgi:uncharacterized membrane protein